MEKADSERLMEIRNKNAPKRIRKGGFEVAKADGGVRVKGINAIYVCYSPREERRT